MIHSKKLRLYFEKELQKLAKLRKQVEKSLRNSPEGTLVSESYCCVVAKGI